MRPQFSNNCHLFLSCALTRHSCYFKFTNYYLKKDRFLERPNQRYYYPAQIPLLRSAFFTLISPKAINEIYHQHQPGRGRKKMAGRDRGMRRMEAKSQRAEGITHSQVPMRPIQTPNLHMIFFSTFPSVNIKINLTNKTLTHIFIRTVSNRGKGVPLTCLP